MSIELAPLDIPIASTNLIEASAGTGKTWNIAALFARLVLLEHLPVDKILVVTFTNAATAELKTRLRKRLNDALRVLQKSPTPEDLQAACNQYAPDAADFMHTLLTRALQQETRARLMLRLKAAISQFDHAAIYTIHSFCQRVLQDFAFYCQVPFALELSEDASAQDFVAPQDFWRSSVAHNPILADLVYRHRQEPHGQATALKAFLARPYLHTHAPQHTLADLAQAQTAQRRAWLNLKMRWTEVQAAFLSLHEMLHKKSYDAKKYPEYFTQLEALIQADAVLPDADLLHAMGVDSSNNNKFEADYLLDKINSKFKNKYNPEYLACLHDTLGVLIAGSLHVATCESDVLLGLSLDLLAYWRTQNERDKQHQATRQFDDLLLDVFYALQHDRVHAATLAQALARQWRVALIDEFQDTDPLQYGIFHRVFASDDVQAADAPALFMVGDPKQAIYRFRGADIFAYLQAADDAKHHYTLTTNRRSHARLIASIGALFARSAPFVLPQVRYETVSASRADKKLPADEPSLRVRWLNDLDECGDKAENVDILRQRAAQWAAQEIAQSLQAASRGEYALGDTPLHAGQIAVLVRNHSEANLMQRELKKVGVHSVLMSRENVFSQDEAMALCALLAFWLNPQQTTSLVYVLSSVLFDYTASQLAALQGDDMALSAWTDVAVRAHQDWQRVGVYAAMQRFLHEQGVLTRLLAQGGERVLTNLGQLMELLAAEDESGRTPAALQQWLAQEIDASQNSGGAENRLLRLESDEHLVKIVTMHASKGLQYPIVYCPFIWAGGKASHEAWRVVQRDGESHLLHHTQLREDDVMQIKNEHLSEDLRLLYVAMTRAEEQLNLYMAAQASTHEHAFYYLLEGEQKCVKTGKNVTVSPNAYYALWQQFMAEQDAACTDLMLQYGAPNVYRVQAAFDFDADKDAVGAPHYQARAVSPRRYVLPQHTSFTALTRQRSSTLDLDAPDNDALVSPALDNHGTHEAEPSAPQSAGNLHPATSDIWDMAHFPQGAVVGVCVHEILEHFRFVQAADTQSERTARILAQYGIDATLWLPAVNDMLDKVRQTPLYRGVRLCDLSNENYLTEMNFVFSIQQFNLKTLPKWLAEQGLPDVIVQAAQTLTHAQVSGFLTGVLDMLIHTDDGCTMVIDHKSNRLADYGAGSLHHAMAQHHYYLQALIYAIASARYLVSRNALPDTIGVRYLFVRGMDGASDAGVWAWDIVTSALKPWLLENQYGKKT